MNWIKTSIKSSSIHVRGGVVVPFIFLIIMSLLSCGKLQGEFALKYPMQDTYRRVTADVEFKSNETVHWIYKLSRVPTRTVRVAVFLLRKEIVWVEIHTSVNEVGLENGIIYGSFDDLPEGQYRLLLTEAMNNTKIDVMDFVVYADGE